jgi:hypothetical protein
MVLNPIPILTHWTSDPANTINAVAASVTAVLFFWSVFIAILQLSVYRQQTNLADRSSWASMFLEIARKWDEILPTRNWVLESMKIRTLKDLEKEYSDESGKVNVEAYRQDKEWLETVRPLCNFYETLGVLLKQRSISPDPLLALVTVDSYESIENTGAEGNTTLDQELAIYRRLKGPIEFVRKYYRFDIYEYYDPYLLTVHKHYFNAISSAKRRKDLAKDAKRLVRRAALTGQLRRPRWLPWNW